MLTEEVAVSELGARLTNQTNNRELFRELFLCLSNIDFLNQIQHEITPEEAVRIYAINPEFKTALSKEIKSDQFSAELLSIEHFYFIEELIEFNELIQRELEALIEKIEHETSQNEFQNEFLLQLQEHGEENFTETQIEQEVRKLIEIIDEMIQQNHMMIENLEKEIESLTIQKTQIENNISRIESDIIDTIIDAIRNSGLEDSYEFQLSNHFMELLKNQTNNDIPETIQVNRQEILDQVKNYLNENISDISSLDSIDFNSIVQNLITSKINTICERANIQDAKEIIQSELVNINKNENLASLSNIEEIKNTKNNINLNLNNKISQLNSFNNKLSNIDDELDSLNAKKQFYSLYNNDLTYRKSTLQNALDNNPEDLRGITSQIMREYNIKAFDLNTVDFQKPAPDLRENPYSKYSGASNNNKENTAPVRSSKITRTKKKIEPETESLTENSNTPSPGR